ncbi:MAG: hypothetical protein QW580_04075 [Nitrososphaerota archaeon]
MVQPRELVSVVALFLFFLLIAISSVFIAELFRTLGRAIGAVLFGIFT